jgi:hypothetical protein
MTPSEYAYVHRPWSACDYLCRYYTERTTNFDVVFSVLRLATKYEVPYFRRHAISIFSAIFPSDVDGLSQRYEYTSVRRMNAPIHHMAVQVLLVSGELRLSSMLPCIHYILATQALTDLLDGVMTSGGRHLELPWNLKRVCLLGRARLVSAYHSQLSLVLRSDPAELQSCNAGGSCKATTCDIATRLSLSFSERDCALLIPGRALFQRPGSRICEPCRARLVAQWDSEIALIWNELPSYFELPSWLGLPSENAHTS